jgi:hypothetical protein
VPLLVAFFVILIISYRILFIILAPVLVFATIITIIAVCARRCSRRL